MAGTKYLSANEIQELGVLLEINRRLLHPVGLTAEIGPNGTIRVEDYRDDPEGVRYKSIRGSVTEPDAVTLRKMSRFREMEEKLHPIRLAALGYIKQYEPA